MTTSTNPAIERLRTAPRVDAEKPTIEQLRGVVEGLRLVRSLPEIAAGTGLTEARVLDLVARLGTWLTHVNGGSGAVAVARCDERQQVLFQAASTPMLRPPDAGRQAGRKQHPSPAAKGGRKADGPRVMVPLGFERRGAHKRDVSKALAAIVVANPDNSVLSRFIEREYPTRSKVLTFTILSSVWWHAQNGRLDTIDELNPDNPTLGELLVEGYDLLATSISQAQEGIKELYLGSDDLDTLAQACTKARWMAEADITKIERLVELARNNGQARAQLDRQLGMFRSSLQKKFKSFNITVADLNAGQVRRIAESAGIKVESATRAEEAVIRTRLKEMGFNSDLDRLVPEGLRATEAGAADIFWEAMEDRRSGNTNWQTRLAEAVAASA